MSYKPEDNAPLQSQQEDKAPSVAPHEKATVETTVAAVVQSEQDVIFDNSWTDVRTIDAEIPRIVATYSWTSTQASGDFLTAVTGSDAVETLPSSPNPFCLPNYLIVNQPASSSGLNVPAQVGLFQALFTRHALYRSGFRVEVTVNGTQFHGGSLFVVAIPHPHVWMQSLTNTDAGTQKKWTALELVQVNQLGIFPSARLLPRNASAVALDLPYVGPAPQLETAALDVMYAIAILVETPLSIPTGTAPTLTVVMRVGATNAHFFAPKPYQTPQSNLGAFDVPLDVPAPASLLQGVRVNTAQSAFVNTSSGSIAQIERRSRSTETTFLPARVEDWRSILSRPTLMSLVQFTAATTLGTNIFQTNVCPTGTSVTNRDATQALPNASIKRLQGTPYLSQLARYFSQWRGSLTYTFEYTGPQVSSGRLLIAFLPGRVRAAKSGQGAEYVETGALLQNFTENLHVIWDLSNSTSVSITCPYAIATPWAPIVINSWQAIPLSGYSSGTLVAVVMSPLVTPTVVAPTSTILVHLSAGSDFEMRFPAPIPVNTIPMYNGIVDQGPAVDDLPQGEHYLTAMDTMSLQTFFNQSRFYGNFSATAGTTASMVTIPLSLISFAPSSNLKVPEAPVRMFAGLFTFLRADLRITVGIPFQHNLIVTYRPPTATPSTYSAAGAGAPDSAASLLNGPSVILSTRASNMGVEFVIPFSAFASVFQTSWSQANRVDTRYNPDSNQTNPGDMGTIFVASRLPSAQLSNVSVFIAFQNAEFFVPRPFPPLTSTGWDGTAPNNLEGEFWEEEDPTPVEFQAPTTEGLEKGDQVMLSVTLDILDSIRELCSELMENVDTLYGRARAAKFAWLVQSTFEEWKKNDQDADEFFSDVSLVEPVVFQSPPSPSAREKAARLEEFFDYMYGCVESEEELHAVCDAVNAVIDSFYDSDGDFIGEIRDRFLELPLSYPEGPDHAGVWFRGEFYRCLYVTTQNRFFPQVAAYSPVETEHNLFALYEALRQFELMCIADPLSTSHHYQRLLFLLLQQQWVIPEMKSMVREKLAFLYTMVAHPERIFLDWNWELFHTQPFRYICNMVGVETALTDDGFFSGDEEGQFQAPTSCDQKFLNLVRAYRDAMIVNPWHTFEVCYISFYDLTCRSDVPEWFKRAVEDACFDTLCARVAERVNVNNEVLIERYRQLYDEIFSEEPDFFSDDEIDAEFQAPKPPAPASSVPVPRPSTPLPSPATSEDEDEGEDEPDDICVYYVDNGLYRHWGIRNKQQAISLKAHGFQCRVSYTPEDLGKHVDYCTVGYNEWCKAVCRLGQIYDYSITHNCTDFVQEITSYQHSFQNTGYWLAAGVVAAAVATTAIFHSVPPSWDERPFLPEKTTPRVVVVPPRCRVHRWRRATLEKIIELKRKMLFQAPINIQLTNPAVDRAASVTTSATLETLDEVRNMVPVLVNSASTVASSLSAASASVEHLTKSMETFLENATSAIPGAVSAMESTAGELISSASKKVASIILKVIGFTLVIFGNPSPSTIAGVIALLVAEVYDNAYLRKKMSDLAVSFTSKIKDLVGSLFGVSSCCDEEPIFTDIDDAFHRYMLTRTETDFEFQAPSRLQEFNQGVLAMKNVEWIIEKIKELIDWLISKLRSKERSSPEDYLKTRADYITDLYRDSLATASCQNVDVNLLNQRVRDTRDMLAYCTNHRLAGAAHILSRTLANYEQTSRKLKTSTYSSRPEPLVIYIHGSPGVGKSLLSNIIASAYCKRKGIDFKTSVFAQPPGSEYFDGYTGQPVHVIDDFCQNTTGEDVKLFCQMVSTTPFVPPMAALEEKGVQYRSRLILATSNMATPQSNEIRIPGALERRCHIKVRAILARAFQTPAGRLDMAEAFKELGPAKSPDFKADCPYLNGAAMTLSVTKGEDRTREHMSVYDLCDMIFDELDERDGNQTAFSKIIFQAPSQNVISFCKHADHSPDSCYNIFIATPQGPIVHRFDSVEDRNSWLQSQIPSLPKAGNVRCCPCKNPDCAKIQFTFKTDDEQIRSQVINFPGRDVAEWWLRFVCGRPGSQYALESEIWPAPPIFIPTAQPIKNESIEKELKKLQKRSLISFTITGISAIASAIGLLIYFLRRRRDPEPQAPYSGAGGRQRQPPQQRPVPQRIVHYQAPYRMPQIYPKVEKNCTSITFHQDSHSFDLTALFICGRTFVCNNHAFSRSHTIEIGGQKYKPEELSPELLVRPSGVTDVVICTLPRGDERKNLVPYLLSQKDRPTNDDVLMVSRSKTIAANFECTNLRGRKSVCVKEFENADEQNFHRCYTYDLKSTPGMCGAALISRNPARETLLGIHFAGGPGVGIGVPLYKEDFAHLFQGNLKPIEHPGQPNHIPRRSALKKSPAYGAFPVKSEPAILSQKDKRCEVDLDEVMFSKHVPDHEGWPTLEPAMAYVVEELMQKCGFSKDDPVPMWTLEQAINGDGVMEGIDMGQSAGYPFSAQGRSRRSFFEWNGEKWQATEELKKLVDHALQHPDDYYYATFLKDELRPSEKVKAGKTRLVDSDSLPRILAMRMVFGPLFEAMLRKNGSEIHSAVGCNPDVDWTRFYYEMGPDSFPYCFDLDYSCFDSSEPKIAFLLMAKYLEPYFQHDVTPFLSAVATSKHVYGDKAYEMEGGMPSGCVGTSMFNCINNSAFIVSALIALKISPDSCKWICYGDDVIISTDEKALSRRIADFYSRNTNLKVTPACKSGDFPEESTFYEVSFLKRFFVHDSHYPQLIHPYMPLEHLEQSSMWQTDGEYQQKLDSLAQLAFHAGGPDYRKFCDTIQRRCRSRGTEVYFRPFEYYMAMWYAHFM
ncbi:polyprotein [Turkey hepatitis virus 2993D]|uniref:Genome polyprotein n=1 Tax=Megrivirus A (isolate Turkey/USA/124/2008) TaxID=980964 RepID=E9L812_MEGR1|nr:polyprotein [Turkey hepatitis virus 2993D]ADN94255.1 polyprotein [megrivirus A1CP-CPOL]